LGIFETGKTSYKNNFTDNSVYLFLIEGKILIDNQILSSKDAMGISNLNEFEIEILEKAKILIIEIPTK
jgi:hypothetical protein